MPRPKKTTTIKQNVKAGQPEQSFKPLGLNEGLLTEAPDDSSASFQSALHATVQSLLSGTASGVEVCESVGVTRGRIAAELATIAFAPGNLALTISEVLTDAAIRNQFLRGEQSPAEKLLIIQQEYKRLAGAFHGSRLEITATNKLQAIAQLRDVMSMRAVRPAYSPSRTVKTFPASGQQPNRSNSPWVTSVPESKVANG
jgi:hypothetical protein